MNQPVPIGQPTEQELKIAAAIIENPDLVPQVVGGDDPYGLQAAATMVVRAIQLEDPIGDDKVGYDLGLIERTKAKGAKSGDLSYDGLLFALTHRLRSWHRALNVLALERETDLEMAGDPQVRTTEDDPSEVEK